MNFTPDEHDLHAYVDGRLDAQRLRAVEQWMERHPERAAELKQWKRDAEHLRAGLAGDLQRLPPSPALDPARIRACRVHRRRARLAIAASLLLSLCFGGLAGWHIRSVDLAKAEPPMGDALQAYRMFAMAPNLHADVIQHNPGQLQSWLRAHFGARTRLPDLGHAGFQPVSGRLLATAQGPAAMVIFRNRKGDAISFYIRPPDAWRGRLPRGKRLQDGLIAQYRYQDGYNVAMVSHADGRDARVIRAALDTSI